MVIFHSYVSLPEGIIYFYNLLYTMTTTIPSIGGFLNEGIPIPHPRRRFEYSHGDLWGSPMT